MLKSGEIKFLIPILKRSFFTDSVLKGGMIYIISFRIFFKVSILAWSGWLWDRKIKSELLISSKSIFVGIILFHHPSINAGPKIQGSSVILQLLYSIITQAWQTNFNLKGCFFDGLVKENDGSIKKSIEGEVLDELGVHKYCCRRMFLGNVHLISYI